MFDSLKKLFKSASGNENWTKNTVLKRIVDELTPLNPVLKANSLIFDNETSFKLQFIANNFADKDKVELNASIFFVDGEDELFWFDIFHLAKAVYGDDYRALTIPKTSEWMGSQLERECKEFLLPVLTILSSEQLATTFLTEGIGDYKEFHMIIPKTEDYQLAFSNGNTIQKAMANRA